jgi:hypothetical protein
MRSFLHSKVFQIGAISFVFLFPFFTHAADLSISPSSGSYSVGKTFPVNIFVSTPSDSINAVSGTLTFPSDKLQVVSVSKISSILTLWVSDPSYSNSDGTVNFEGVVPNPGFIGSSGRVVTVNFKVIAAGAGSVKWSAGSVLANDGSGTNVLHNLNTANFTLVAGGSAPVVAPPTAVVPATPTPTPASTGGIKISSATYPDPTKWYLDTDGIFSWNVPDTASAVRILVGKLADATPSVVYDPPIDSKQINGSGDGIWYFSIQPKSGSKWGAVSHYEFKVDSTPPESFTVKAIPSNDPTDPSPDFAFTATDSTSGIDHYTVAIDVGKPIVWNDNASGIYSVKTIAPGQHTILAKAYDAAGNSTPASVDFIVTAIESPKVTSYTDNVSATKPLIIKGTAPANVSVKVTLLKGAGIGGLFSTVSAQTTPYTQSVDSDGNGAWSMSVDTSKFESGAYDMFAITIDSRGAQSYPTASKTILINSSWWQSIGSSVVKVLAVGIPVIALLFFLVVVFLHGFHRVRRTNNKYVKEVRNIERLVAKAFALLKEDVEDSIKLLERTKSKRELTKEEDAIVKRLRQNLTDAEDIINKQVQKVEDEIED